MGAVSQELLLFRLRQLFQIRTHGTESQLAIEPESAGVNGFFIAVADLIRINRNDSDPVDLPQKTQGLGVNPCGFSVAIGGKSIEADFHPIEERDPLNV